MTFANAGRQETPALSDPRDQVDRRPSLVLDEVPRRRGRLTEGTGKRLAPGDGSRYRDRDSALGTGEGSHPEPRDPLGRANLDPGGGGAKHLVALLIAVREWVEDRH